MQSTIAIIDYQLSNLFSVVNACEHLGEKALITSDPATLLSADAAILPGVGAFGDAMANLKKLGLVDAIHDFVQSGRPLMGVCLGLQLLMTESEEFGIHQGLNIIPGSVKRFPAESPNGTRLKIPQIGWNQITPPSDAPDRWASSPLKHIAPGTYMYFVHSFFAQPTNSDDILTRTTYEGFEYTSSVLRNNVFAVQFHPEKSGETGISIYREWLDQTQ